MIIKFSIENWMSFRNPASFSMIASRERQHVKESPSRFIFEHFFFIFFFSCNIIRNFLEII